MPAFAKLSYALSEPETKSSTDQEPPRAKAMSPLKMGQEIHCEEFEAPLYRHRYLPERL